MFKKLFTDWKKEYGIFWLITGVFIGAILAIDSYFDDVGLEDVVMIVLIVALFHVFFFGFQYAFENDKRIRLENHTLTLVEFSKEYGLTEKEAVHLLQEGVLEGTIFFKTYPLREKTKEEVQQLVNKEPN